VEVLVVALAALVDLVAAESMADMVVEKVMIVVKTMAVVIITDLVSNDGQP
jgi:hypothetical protein